MQKTSERVEVKNLTQPDEVRTFEKGKVELFKVGGRTIGRATFEPGWSWSTCMAPLVKTEKCQDAHLGYQLSGRMHLVMEGGEELEMKAGDFLSLPAGHLGWVVGDEPVVVLDFQGMLDYAKPKESRRQRKH